MVDWEKQGKVARNAFEAIGLTPLVRLNKVNEVTCPINLVHLLS